MQGCSPFLAGRRVHCGGTQQVLKELQLFIKWEEPVMLSFKNRK